MMRRRDFLAGAGTAVVGGLAGCTSGSSGSPTTTGAEFDPTTTGRTDAPTLDSLRDLEGSLTIYLGRGEGGRYAELLEHFVNELYQDLELSVRRNRSATLANSIILEESGGTTPADLFWSIDAGSLGAVARAGLSAPLPRDLVEVVPTQFRDADRRWAGVAGRVRAIPYNADAVDPADIPDAVAEIPDSPIAGAMGWAPTYGAFQAFVTAMRLRRGETATREWLSTMVEAGTQSYAGEFLVTNAVADGELKAGFANHYYALRLQQAKPDAPLELAFTRGDAGSLINVSGALVPASSENQALAANLLRHLHTAEVQQFLAEEAYEYPLVAGVEPPGSLPALTELEPPAIDLTRLADLEATLDLLRGEGVL